MRFRRIPELDNERMPLECLMHDAALDPAATSVNEADFAKTEVPCGGDVLFDDRLDVAGGECVEVEGVFDRDPACHGAV